MKRAFVVFAAAVISTAALADGGNLIGSGTRSGPIVGGNSAYLGGGSRSPYLGGTGGRIDTEDGSSAIGTGLRSPFMGGGSGRVEGEEEDSPMLGGGGARSGLLTGSNSTGMFGSGLSIVVHLERMK